MERHQDENALDDDLGVALVDDIVVVVVGGGGEEDGGAEARLRGARVAAALGDGGRSLRDDEEGGERGQVGKRTYTVTHTQIRQKRRRNYCSGDDESTSIS